MASKIQILNYYDIQCDKCSRFRSSDFGAGLEDNKGRLQRTAYREGWGRRANMTLCPDCLREYDRERQMERQSPRSHMPYPCRLSPKIRYKTKKERVCGQLACHGSKRRGQPISPECLSCKNYISNVILATKF